MKPLSFSITTRRIVLFFVLISISCIGVIGLNYFPNLKLTGVRQRAKNDAVRPVERTVRLFGFCVISVGRGLGLGLRGTVYGQAAVFAFVGLDFSAGIRGDDGEVEGFTGQSTDQVSGDFNASGGGESSGRVGARADHKLDGDHGDAYSLQQGGD